MSESLDEQGASVGVNDVAPVAEPPAPAVPLPSAGTLLREARVAAGVDLMTLAQALKVSVKKIEALEADAYDRLPDAVFTRGLASSVCRALKVDAKPILDCMPNSPAPRLAQEEGGLNTPFQTPGDVAKTPLLDQLSRPMILAAVAILLGAIVLVFFPSAERRSEIGGIVSNASPSPARSEVVESMPPARGGMTDEVASSAHVEVVPSTPVPLPAAAPKLSEPASPVVKASPAPASTSTPTVVPATAPSAATVRAAPAATPSPAASVAPATSKVTAAEVPVTVAADVPRKKLPGTGVVVFKTTGSSWVNVTDAQGGVLLSRAVEPDEPVGVSGKMPLSISIGRADLTTVTVRGQPYDLAPVTRQGVARFELK
jgi:cytoskeleton protein RodZ